MTERFNRAYNKLTDSFFNGTLRAGDCAACAVGNIVGDSDWRRIFLTPFGGGEPSSQKMAGEGEYLGLGGVRLFIENYPSMAKVRQEAINKILSTGYTVQEMAKVEEVFEATTKHKAEDLGNYAPGVTEKDIVEDQYNGLRAVIELLMSFDDIEGAYPDKLKEHPLLQEA